MEQALTLDALSFFKEVRDLYKETDRRIKEMSQETDRKFREMSQETDKKFLPVNKSVLLRSTKQVGLCNTFVQFINFKYSESFTSRFTPAHSFVFLPLPDNDINSFFHTTTSNSFARILTGGIGGNWGQVDNACSLF